nr:Ig domain-containing protein [Lachnospiraceae bacterium]
MKKLGQIEKQNFLSRLIVSLLVIVMCVGTIPARAEQHIAVSDWTKFSEVPLGAEIVDRKWVYDYNDYQETESYESSLSGWTQTGSEWRQSGSGSVEYAYFPSTYNTEDALYTSMNKGPLEAYENASAKRTVNNTWKGYIYWHWMYNVNYANNTARMISDRKGSFDQYGKSGGFWFGYFSAFKSSVDCPYLDNYYCCSRNQPSYNCVNVMPDKSSLGTGTPRYFRFDYYASNYTDYKKIYFYKKGSVEKRESKTEVVAGGNISNVEIYVKYNYYEEEIYATGVKLNKNSTSIPVGGTEKLIGTISPSNATRQNLLWTTSNSNVATVSSEGVVTAVSIGTATITAKTFNGKTDTCVVTVIPVGVTGVSLNKTSLSLEIGSSESLTATISPSNATDKSVSWTTSNASVATVSNGKVTGVAAGTATITVKTNNGKTATCTVTVDPVSVKSVSLNKTSLTLDIGKSETLTATISPSNAANKTLTWTSSNTSVATVTSSGQVTVKAAGTATITVKTNNGKTATCTVTVNPVAVTSVILDKVSLTLTVGKSETLTATISPSNATDKTLTWTSSNTSVATVTSSGKVTAVAPGKATITAKSTNGKYSSCIVEVTKNKTFTWSRDNWSFFNWTSYFGSGTHRSKISDHYVKALESVLDNVEFVRVFGDRNTLGYINSEWKGSCYGMSVLETLSTQGVVPYANYKSGAKSLYELSLTSDVKSLVTYYHMLQKKTVIRQHFLHRMYNSHKQNIQDIIALLDKNAAVLICFCTQEWGHAIVAYDYEYGSWTKNGVTYQGRILISDPNSSYSDDRHIYFNTTTYSWEIPYYKSDGGASSKGAYIDFVGSDINELNAGGYLSGNNRSYGDSFIARVDALKIASDRSITKVEEKNGQYTTKNSGPNDIKEDFMFDFSGSEQSGTVGYTLFDPDASYEVKQKSPVELDLLMDYEDCDLYGYSAAGESIIFDKEGLVLVKGQSANYSIKMVFNKNYPTKWFAIGTSGNSADLATLRKSEEGYIITSDNLKGVQVTVSNKEESLTRTLTTTYPSALIYQKASGGIGFKVDTDNNGTYETALNADDMPTISKQPANCTCNENETAVFAVTAKGTGLTYLWQYKNAGATSWTSWTTKTTASISVAYSSARNGMKLRCIITDADGKQVISNTATLNYNISIAITTQPSSVTVNEGKSADFTVVAKGSGLKYLWQYKEAGKSSWTDWTSKTTASINVAYAANRDGMSLRCVVTDASGKKVTSNVATLTYNYPLSITKQPASVTVTANSAASFSVTATGKGLKYLWQYKEAGKSSWTDWTSKTTASISVAFADYRDRMSLRCVVTDASGKKVTSNIATLTYNYPLSITKQPASVTVTANSAASFSVTATGKGLKYLWQYKEAGKSSWTDWTSKTTASISV